MEFHEFPFSYLLIIEEVAKTQGYGGYLIFLPKRDIENEPAKKYGDLLSSEGYHPPHLQFSMADKLLF